MSEKLINALKGSNTELGLMNNVSTGMIDYILESFNRVVVENFELKKENKKLREERDQRDCESLTITNNLLTMYFEMKELKNKNI